MTEAAAAKPRYLWPSLAAGLAATTALSSAATQHVAHLLGNHPALGRTLLGFYEPAAWIAWQAEPWASGVTSAFLLPNCVAGGIAAAFALTGVAVNVRRGSRPKPFADVHGSAEWATIDDIRAAKLLGNPTGVYVGAWEDPATGRVHYLRDTSGAHVAGIAPTRSGKGLGLVLPNLLSSRESLVVYDPKAELWQLSAGWRKSIGQTVIRWQPAHPTACNGFNFLEEVRIGTEYEVGDAQNLATMLIDQDGEGFDSHWDKTAFGFLTGAILHALYCARNMGLVASLPSLAALLSSPTLDPLDLCRQMALNTHLKGQTHPAVAAAGVDQLKRDERERGAVLSTVKTCLSLFLDPIVARNCETSSFRLSDLMDADDPTSLYIMVSGADNLRLRPLVRLMLTTILNQMTSVPVGFDAQQRPIQPHRHKMLMLLDEFPTLGKLAVFEASMAVMAGFGITALLLMQDRQQLFAAYDQTQTILANCHVVSAYAPNELSTAEWLSHELGSRTINLEQLSESGKRGLWLSQVARSFSPMARPLMTADEVKRMPGPLKAGNRVIGAGRMLVLPTGQRPVYGRQILYFEDPTFDARSRILPPLLGDRLVQTAQFQSSSTP